MFKIGFTGHRDTLADVVELVRIRLDNPAAVWVHGGAKGFDSQINSFCKVHDIETQIIKPDYERYGRPAPLIRNREIVDSCSVLVACYDGRKSGGTFYTINYAIKVGRITIFINPRDRKNHVRLPD